jgi:hypothetical protein
MNRRKFIGITGGTVIAVGTTTYLFSDKSNLVRADIKPVDNNNKTLKPDEKEILFLASLAPSGHEVRGSLVVTRRGLSDHSILDLTTDRTWSLKASEASSNLTSNNLLKGDVKVA